MRTARKSQAAATGQRHLTTAALEASATRWAGVATAPAIHLAKIGIDALSAAAPAGEAGGVVRGGLALAAAVAHLTLAAGATTAAALEHGQIARVEDHAARACYACST